MVVAYQGLNYASTQMDIWITLFRNRSDQKDSVIYYIIVCSPSGVSEERVQLICAQEWLQCLLYYLLELDDQNR